jgi:hypothetical protein
MRRVPEERSLPPPLEKQALAPMDQAQSMMSQYFIPHIELECRQIGLSFRRLRSSDHKKQPLVRSCEEEGEKEEGGGGRRHKDGQHGPREETCVG